MVPIWIELISNGNLHLTVFSGDVRLCCAARCMFVCRCESPDTRCVAAWLHGCRMIRCAVCWALSTGWRRWVCRRWLRGRRGPTRRARSAVTCRNLKDSISSLCTRLDTWLVRRCLSLAPFSSSLTVARPSGAYLPPGARFRLAAALPCRRLLTLPLQSIHPHTSLVLLLAASFVLAGLFFLGPHRELLSKLRVPFPDCYLHMHVAAAQSVAVAGGNGWLQQQLQYCSCSCS
jgi:hypothetical protein